MLLVNLFKIKVFLLPKISNYLIFLFISNIKFLPRNCWQLMVLTQSLSGMFHNWPASRQSVLSPDDLYDGGGEGETEHDVDGAEQHVDGPV